MKIFFERMFKNVFSTSWVLDGNYCSSCPTGCLDPINKLYPLWRPPAAVGPALFSPLFIVCVCFLQVPWWAGFNLFKREHLASLPQPLNSSSRHHTLSLSPRTRFPPTPCFGFVGFSLVVSLVSSFHNTSFHYYVIWFLVFVFIKTVILCVKPRLSIFCHGLVI